LTANSKKSYIFIFPAFPHSFNFWTKESFIYEIIPAYCIANLIYKKFVSICFDDVVLVWFFEGATYGATTLKSSIALQSASRKTSLPFAYS
jgi:hypothetical protein